MTEYLLYPALSTHRGRRRDQNEDAVAFMIPSDPAKLRRYGALFLVADGVGGVAHGERASDRALRFLIHEYYQADAPDSIDAHLVELIQRANMLLHETPEQGATTLVAAVIRGATLTVASVGDSAAYWLSGGQPQKLTEDHIMVIDPANPKKRKLTRALGHQPTLSVDTVSGTVTPGARLLLVSDGVTRHFDDQRLHDLCTGGPPVDSVRAVILAANEAGGTDNISVVLVEIGSPCADDETLYEHVQNLHHVFVEIPDFPIALFVPPAPAAPAPEPPPLAVPVVSTPATLPAPAPRQRNPARLVMALAGLAVVVVLGFWLATRGGSNSPEPGPTDHPPTSSSPSSPSTADHMLDPDTAPLTVGTRVRFSTSAITYAQIGGEVAAFVLNTSQGYAVRDIYTGRDNITWYQLFDSESEHYGWIALPDLPDYRLD